MKPGLRRRLTLLVTVVALITLGAVTAGFNIALRSSLDNDAAQLVDGRAQAAAEAVSVRGERVLPREGAQEPAPDAQVWVFVDGRPLERPATATAAEDASAMELAARGAGRLQDDRADVLLGAVPLRATDGSAAGVLVAAVSIEPYERTANRALVASVVFAALITLLIGIATWVVVGRALHPVARMTADVANWSEHDLDRRFSVGEPTDELTQLASTFDGLLDRMSALLRHEKRFSAELSHELRTPVASIAAEAELALRRERDAVAYRDALTQIRRKTAELTEILETLLLAARQEGEVAEGVADLGAVIEQTAATLEPIARACRVTVATELPPKEVTARVEAIAVRRLLTPLIENACAFGETAVSIALTAAPGVAVIHVRDDGPGLDAGEDEQVFTPGWRGEAPRNRGAPDGTGLGLPLARRLARAMGGEIRIITGSSGADFEVRLPLSG